MDRGRVDLSIPSRRTGRAAAALLVLLGGASLFLVARRARTEEPGEGGDETEIEPPPESSSASEPLPPPPPPSSDGMLLVSGASFRMGSTAPKSEPNETPVHGVTVSPFWLDVAEVTVGEYRSCVAASRCKTPTITSSDCTWERRDDKLPMSCVSHAESADFCTSAKKRLPTEAEWELAARGSTDRRYPWGNDAPDCSKAVTMKAGATADSCGDHGPRVVGGRQDGRSRAGILDLAGNLEEWVADFYDDRYPEADQKDPRGPSTGTSFVLRGGGWQSPRASARTTARSWGGAQERGTNVGFRCARDAGH